MPDKQKDLKVWSEKMHHMHDELTKTAQLRLKREKEKYWKSILLKIALILAMAGVLWIDFQLMFSSSTPKYDDVLTPMDDEKTVEKISSYIRLVCELVNKEGIAAIEQKWVDGIPPDYKKNSKAKFEKLASEGFTVEKMYSDKNDITFAVLRLRSYEQVKDPVIVQIAKEKIDEASVFRILRIQ